MKILRAAVDTAGSLSKGLSTIRFECGCYKGIVVAELVELLELPR